MSTRPKPKFKKGDLIQTTDSPRFYGILTSGPNWNVMSDDWGYDLTIPPTSGQHKQTFRDVGESGLQKCSNVFPGIDPTSAKILTIRFKAGNNLLKCPTCNRSPDDPFRTFENPGVKIRGATYHDVPVSGCIDPIHTGHITSQSLAWHNRKEAKELRSKELKHLQSL